MPSHAYFLAVTTRLLTASPTLCSCCCNTGQGLAIIRSEPCFASLYNGPSRLPTHFYRLMIFYPCNTTQRRKFCPNKHICMCKTLHLAHAKGYMQLYSNNQLYSYTLTAMCVFEDTHRAQSMTVFASNAHVIPHCACLRNQPRGETPLRTTTLAYCQMLYQLEDLHSQQPNGRLNQHDTARETFFKSTHKHATITKGASTQLVKPDT